jgi:hypothetical protein
MVYSFTSSLKTDIFGMLLKSVFVSVNALFLRGCVHPICNKSREMRHAGHITKERTVFQIGHTYNPCYYNQLHGAELSAKYL